MIPVSALTPATVIGLLLKPEPVWAKASVTESVRPCVERSSLDLLRGSCEARVEHWYKNLPLVAEHQFNATDLVTLDPRGHERRDRTRSGCSGAEDSVARTRLRLDRDVAAGLGEERCKLDRGRNVGRLHRETLN
jgi:hypothetical protein